MPENITYDIHKVQEPAPLDSISLKFYTENLLASSLTTSRDGGDV